MPKKIRIEPTKCLALCTSNIQYINLAVIEDGGSIIHLDYCLANYRDSHSVLNILREKIDSIIDTYEIDTLLLEENKLFIDKVEKYPDPYVLRNVLLGYKIQSVIEYLYYDKIKYILEIPEQEWRTKVLNKFTKYAIDLYKSHIFHKDLDEETLKTYDEYNYYKVLCFSESILYDSLMNVKYQINRE